MRNTDTFRQYIWLVDKVLHSKKISLNRIQKLWIDDDMNDRRPLSRTTFYRLRQAIEDMFGISIKCDISDSNQYYINNPEVLKDNSTQHWMFQTLTVNNVLIDSLAIKDRLVLEEIPEGILYLQTIIKAIKTNHILSIEYQKFDDPKGYTASIEPYCLKVFRQRWYLLGNNISNEKGLQVYALDRVIHIDDTNLTFQIDPEFNASDFFRNYFGVIIGEKPIRIIIRAYEKMIPLLRTLPKHLSQKEISTEEDYSDFEYFLAPTLDFKHDILKEGSDLQVLEPKSFRDEIISMLNNTLALYHS